MAPKQPPVILPPSLTLEKLLAVQQLLHLTVHRNKNQHRITKWWGNLQLLRRNVSKLVRMLESPEAQYRRGKEALLKLANWMAEEIVPRTYLSFSAVVADNQYASLGLMLMGCLARVDACVSFPRGRVLSEEVDNRGEGSSRAVIPSEDFGEAITREEQKLQEEVVKDMRGESKKEEGRGREVLYGKSMSRKTFKEHEMSTKPSLKRDVLDVESSSEEEYRQLGKKVNKIKKVSRKFVEEFDHLSGNSSEEEPVPKKSKRATLPAQLDTSDNEEEAMPPTKRPKKQTDSSDSEEEVQPPPKKAKKVTSVKAGKPLKKKKKRGGDDFDDLFAGLM